MAHTRSVPSVIDQGVVAPKVVPIVCVGLSAGGLPPLKKIFERLDPATGMAFVIVAHVSRTKPSDLPWLMSRWSAMPVEFACPGLVLKPNHIYIIPAGQEIVVADGYFRIRPRSKPRGWSNVVTLFLESLVKHRIPPGIAVILSGVDSDGAEALTAFRERGGVTIVQTPETAEQADMPRAAIATGAVDYILNPPEIAQMLEALAKNSRGQPRSADECIQSVPEE